MPHARSLGPPDPQAEVGCPYSERGGGVQCRVTGSPGVIAVMIVHGRRRDGRRPGWAGRATGKAAARWVLSRVAKLGAAEAALSAPVTKACGP